MIKMENLILKEIEIVQSEIARFDNNGLTVKGLCLSVWAGLIAYGVQNRNALIVAVAIVTTISFSLVEMMYRLYQLRFIARSKKIEELLCSNDLTEYKYSIYSCAVGKQRVGTLLAELRDVLLLPHFTMFYVILAIFALVCAVYVLLALAPQ